MYSKIIPVLFLIIVILTIVFYNRYFTKQEGFDNYNLENAMGRVPSSEINALVQQTYPITGRNGISNNGAANIWWHYPIFSAGSYKQLTNNLRYWRNPDEGTCIRADFCGAMYHDKKNTKSNEVFPLPPAEEGPGARVGYYRSEPNALFYSIPTNENILY